MAANKFHKTPWHVNDLGNGKVHVVDANGNFVIYRNSDLSFEQWVHVAQCVNKEAKNDNHPPGKP